jgi:hypothetical protein
MSGGEEEADWAASAEEATPGELSGLKQAAVSFLAFSRPGSGLKRPGRPS